jgi:hypothetical protein
MCPFGAEAKLPVYTIEVRHAFVPDLHIDAGRLGGGGLGRGGIRCSGLREAKPRRQQDGAGQNGTE